MTEPESVWYHPQYDVLGVKFPGFDWICLWENYTYRKYFYVPHSDLAAWTLIGKW